MKAKGVAGVVAGLLLAGAAGAVLGHRRRKQSMSVPAKPETAAGRQETPEHAALREILERSVAYNDALYQRVSALETMPDAEARKAAWKELVQLNQEERRAIDALRAALQAHLAELGYGFTGIDGFTELISEFRFRTLVQQERHLEVYERVRLLPGVADTPELHAYLKLGYSDEAQRQADTAEQMNQAIEAQRGIMLRVGRLLAGVKDAASAAAVQDELVEGNKRYQEWAGRMRMYRQDDPEGASESVEALRTMYAALMPPLHTQAAQLQQSGCFGDARLVAILSRLLPDK